MDVFPKGEVLIVSGVSIFREGYARYPIFSLKASDTKLLAAMRKHLSKLGISYQEVALPGLSSAEIGFVFRWRDGTLIDAACGQMPPALEENWLGLFQSH